MEVTKTRALVQERLSISRRNDGSPPHDEKLEKATLGSIFLRGEIFSEVAKIVGPGDFFTPAARETFRAMIQLASDGKPPGDHLQVIAKLAESKVFQGKGDVAGYIAEVAQAVPTAAHATDYAVIIKGLANRRSASTVLGDLFEKSHDGVATGDLIAQAQIELDELGRAARGEPAIDLGEKTAAELIETAKPIPYLIPGVLPAGQPAILAGPFKTLKTSIALDLAVGLASGTTVLGHFDVPRAASVGFISGESGEATLANTIERICRARDVMPEDLDRLLVSTKIPNLARADHVDALGWFIRQHELELLIVDPAYLAMASIGDDAGNVFKMGAVLGRVSRLIEETGCGFLLVHHSRRGTGDGLPKLSDVSWSGFSEWCRSWLLVNARGEWDADVGKHRLWLACGGSAGHGSSWAADVTEGHQDDPGGRHWEVRISSATEANKAAKKRATQVREADRETAKLEKIEEAREAILGALRTAPDHRDTKTRLQERSGHKGETFALALAQALQLGQIEPVDLVRQNGQTYPGFRRVWRD